MKYRIFAGMALVVCAVAAILAIEHWRHPVARDQHTSADSSAAIPVAITRVERGAPPATHSINAGPRVLRTGVATSDVRMRIHKTDTTASVSPTTIFTDVLRTVVETVTVYPIPTVPVGQALPAILSESNHWFIAPIPIPLIFRSTHTVSTLDTIIERFRDTLLVTVHGPTDTVRVITHDSVMIVRRDTVHTRDTTIVHDTVRVRDSTPKVCHVKCDHTPTTTTPEPGTFVLAASGVVGLFLIRRRRV